MMGTISHNIQEETLESKARWFQSLPVSERIELLCQFTDLVFENNPTIAERKNDQPAPGRVRVIEFENAWQNRITMKYQGQEFYVASKEDLIASKRAAGREKDMEDVGILELSRDENEA